MSKVYVCRTLLVWTGVITYNCVWPKGNLCSFSDASNSTQTDISYVLHKIPNSNILFSWIFKWFSTLGQSIFFFSNHQLWQQFQINATRFYNRNELLRLSFTNFNIFDGLYITQLNIYDGAFIAKIVKC